MRQMKIGLVDLDTSHPENWLPIIRRLGHDVVGVYDSGGVYPDGYAQIFAQKHEVSRVYDTLEKMADEVDTAFIHSCNWEVHLERALPFIKAGKAVFIDKPMSANANELLQLKKWVDEGCRITGGSSLRFCEELEHWKRSHSPDEKIVYALAGCGIDDFNYGIHAYSLLHGLFGPGIESVRHIGCDIQRQVELRWRDGRRGMLSIGETKSYLPFYVTIVTDSDVSSFQVDSSKIYEELLRKVLPYLAGEEDEPVPFGQLMEVEKAAIAARLSEIRGGELVRINSIGEDESVYDGKAFESFYREKKLQASVNL